MANRTIPLIDEQSANPFYCPEYPATIFADALRRRLRSHVGLGRIAAGNTQIQDYILLQSFARNLDRALLSEDSDQPCPSYQDSVINAALSFPSESSGQQELYTIPSWERQSLSTLAPNEYDLLPRDAPKRKRRSSSDSFSDIQRPTKYAKSYQSVHDSSFEVDLKAHRLNYFCSDACYSPYDYEEHAIRQRNNQAPGRATPTIRDLTFRVQALEDELCGPPIGTESPRDINAFITRLDALLPGIRLKERLLQLDHPTHQKIADFLADNGLLNSRTLNTLRTSEIWSLSLVASLGDENGLNISGREVLRAFNLPNSFLFLSELSFSGTPLDDFDLVHIHHLPKLATLFLDNTNIGNEAIFLLISLKYTLTHLRICANSRIDDAAVPALLLLSKLSHLSIIDTSIEMDGLRLLLATVLQEKRPLDVEIPFACEQYIDNMDSKYLVHPTPPLIVNPAVCPQLSTAALERNLAKHAECNPNIVASGTREEMMQRLENILKTREMDLLVKEMIWGDEVLESDGG